MLGPLQVHRDGAEVAVPSTRQRAVLAALLLRHDQVIDVDHLVEAAWEGRLPNAPRAALHTVMSRLRSLLGPGVIESAPNGYRLVLDGAALDSEIFETLCDRAADAPPGEAAGLIDRALRLWRDDVLTEFADRQFVEAEASRLAQRRLVAQEERAALQIQLGDVEAAVAGMTAMVHAHPLRERACALLMRALYLAGRPSEALERFQEHRSLLADELGLDPSPELCDLQLQILDHGIPRSVRPTERHHVPRWLADDTTFVGREHALAELADTMVANRLTTVTGTGGVGKSRLAAEAIGPLSRRLALPVTVVEVGALGRIDLDVAAALGIGHVGDDVTSAVVEYLEVTPMLLVLDGCEHARDAVAAFAAILLRRCSRARLLVTSRRRLGIHAEQVLPLPPLAVGAERPEDSATSDHVSADPATALFVDRARRLRPTLTIGRRQREVVRAICQALDGLPLAIELAATRAATLGVEAVQERLDRCLDLLQDPDTGSLRSALDWSYDLLSDSEQALLCALAVFEGPFDLTAVEHVATQRAAGSVAGELAGLVDASLVVGPGNGHGRYRLLQIVRSFALERLRLDGEADIRRAHAYWVRSLVTAVEAASSGPQDAAAAADLDAHAVDIRTAVTWALENDRADLAGEITGTLTLASTMWQVRPDIAAVVRQVAGDEGVRATASGRLAQAAGAMVAAAKGDVAEGERAARSALALARTVDERFLALGALGVSTLYGGNHSQSRRSFQQILGLEGLPLARLSTAQASLALVAHYGGDRSGAQELTARALSAGEIAGAVAHRGYARYAAAEVVSGEDLAAAVPLLAAATQDADAVGARFVGGLANTARLAALIRLGRRDEAFAVVRPLLDRWLRLAVWPQLWTTLRIFAELLARDRPELAMLLLAAADHAPSAPAVTGADVVRYAELTATLRARIDPAAFGRITELAAMLPRTQVVDRARAASHDRTIAGTAGIVGPAASPSTD
ncbi:BTAD domain-containing putative transcriptional regulator [Georgenia halophila]|uniref:BTAD domain-containing putative transcriptional regulator n=1 Tax=Georgenia halophila TaxID=620889 RepID=A0ABP8LJ90_9MICO